jgi:D-amino-acid oxidase
MRLINNHEYIKMSREDPPGWLQDVLPSSEIMPCRFEWRGAIYDRVWKFPTIVIDMDRYMRWLRRWADSLGVVFRSHHLESLAEVFNPDTSAVVNCSGLGAKSLARDWSIRPIRGQVLFLETIEGSSIEPLVSVGIDEYCLVPRITDIALGSLVEDDGGSNNVEPKYSEKSDEKLRAALGALMALCGINRSSLEFCGRSAIGLRPSRKGGFRLEAKKERGGLVIHNYGHGGAGVTLAWGCADQVARVALSSLDQSDHLVVDVNTVASGESVALRTNN